MDGLKALAALGLRNNDLHVLPRQLGWLQRLQQLSVSGNAKLRLPKLVHSGGCRQAGGARQGPADCPPCPAPPCLGPACLRLPGKPALPTCPPGSMAGLDAA
jgi:hypothetical protein